GHDDFVTGEAVAIELPAATFPVRMLSGLIDVVVTVFAIWALSLVGSVVATQGSEALFASAMLLAFVFALVGLPVTLETLLQGRSLGKLALGLRTVRDDAGPIGFRHALTRALIGVVEIWLLFGVPALVSALVSERGKRLGDLAAGTYVVRERVRLVLPLPVQMPPHLAGWAEHADIAALPDPLALALRQFLGRAHALTPAVRADLGRRLADQTLQHVAPAPPPGTHPEHVIAAVIADRRRRDADRLRRETDLRRRFSGGPAL
ncbi:MAG TPA: RDD family protein, partial [Segeticoccus sp.]|nr:RDD family protein [Segeticoccus sp.]